MLIKAKRLLYIGFILVFTSVNAQNITKSPYSSFGIGELQFGGNAEQYAMGQVTQGVRFPGLLNNQNPASYSSIRLTTWNAGGIGTIGSISNSNASGGVSTATFMSFSAGFNLSKKRNWGLSFGLMPMSGIGYNITRNVVTSTFQGSESVSGNGGLNKFYIGTGFTVLPRLSLGVNAGYAWGQIDKVTLLMIPASYNMFNLVENRTRFINGLSFDIGTQYADTIVVKDKLGNEKRYQYGVGFTFTPNAAFEVSDNRNVRSLGIGNTNSGSIGKDTVLNESVANGVLNMPLIVKGGLFFHRIDNWGIGVDFGYQSWKDYRQFGISDSLKNTLGFNIGAYYKTNANNVKNYFNRIEYRAGIRFDNGMISTNNTNVNTIAYAIGFGFPLDRIGSKINVAAEYLNRGTTTNTLVKEEYFRLVIGVSFNDMGWFRRYKYD